LSVAVLITAKPGGKSETTIIARETMKPSASIRRISIGLFVVGALIIAWASQAAAQISISGNITATLTGPNPNECPSGYPHQCSGFNATPCENFTMTGASKVTGNFGVGTLTSFCVTLDPGNNVNEPKDLDTKQTCTPIYGDLIASTKRKGVPTNTSVNFAGVICHHQKTSSTDTIEAGFGIEGQDTDLTATGWGTLTGTRNNNTKAISLIIKGSLTP
jgi:hypothetical protein